MDKLDIFYANVLRVCLANKKITMLVVVAIFVLSMLPMALGWIGTDFMQTTDGGRLNISIEFL